MPWCESCSRYYNPNTLPADARCPGCGIVVAAGEKPARAGRARTQAKADADVKVKDARAPWHFWLLVAAATVYLAWRAIQGIGWLAGHL